MDRDDQHSIENQERECRAYAKSKGWEVVAVKMDVGKSGYKPGTKRPGFDEAMNLIATKQADVFLVWKLSRFIRQLRQFHIFLELLLAEYKAKFDSVTDPVDYTNATGEMILSMIAGAAQLESSAKADFTKSWNDGRVLDGAVPQGPRPFGYDRIAKEDAARDSKGHLMTLKVNSKESEIISFAAEQLLSGKGTLRGIVRDLQEFQGTKDTKLTITGLRSALKNPTIAGLRRVIETDEETKEKFLVDYAPGCWEPILPRETWEAVNEVLSDPKRTNGTGSNERKHLLSGIMECGKCGGKFGVRKWKQLASKKNKAREGHRYVCFDCFNSAGTVVIENAVKDRLLATVDQKAWETLKEQGRGYDPEVIADIESEEQVIYAMWKAKKIKAHRYAEMKEELDQRLAQATGAEPLDLPDLKNLANEWDDASVVDKRRVLKVVFQEIKLDPANGSRNTIGRLFLTRAV